MPFYTIRPRAGTKAQWEQSNMVLKEREIGYEIPNESLSDKRKGGEVKWRK